MAKTKISEFSTTAGNNTDINSINIAEGCAPSGINDAIRELMRQLKEFQTGGAGDSVNSGGDFSVATNKFTVASASGNTAVAGTLGVTGAATLSSTLAVTGTTTLTGALVANGNATLGDGSGDTVTVKGTPTLEVNPTLSGGTANGVLYLNGSKVATSGSALTFDGTNFATTGSATATLLAATKAGQALVYVTDTSSSASQFAISAQTGNETWLGTTTNNSLAFRVNGSEQMRLTSTGLGIGTSSPASKLHVSGASAKLYIDLGGNNYYQASNQIWQNYGGGTEFMRLDTSGNLGLGVTPSAWQTPFKNIQVGNGAGFTGRTDAMTAYMSSNYYNSSGDKYIGTGNATLYIQGSGAHIWYTAPSGTAGNAITFTQAMTLDASGRLLIGATSGTRKLEVHTGNGTETAILLNQSGVGAATLSVPASTNALAFGVFEGGSGLITERARIDGSGNFMVGTTSAVARLDVRGKGYFETSTNPTNGAVLTLTNQTTTSNNGAKLVLDAYNIGTVAIGVPTNDSAIAFYCGPTTERARIDSSGNLLVGTSAFANSNTNSAILQASSGTCALILQHDTGNVSGNAYEVFNYNGSAIGSITQSGTAAVLYNVTSDQRLKENIADAASSSELIDALQVRQFNWKADGSHQRYGFVAQELVTVAPEAVHQPVDPEEMMAVDYSKLVPMLVKEIQSLRARVSQLESN